MNITKTIEVDLNRLHDVIIDVFYHDNVNTSNITDAQLERTFNNLPKSVQAIAFAWGGSDTVFGDEAYVYIQEHKDLFKTICELTTESNKKVEKL